jgi:hypothetical protein
LTLECSTQKEASTIGESLLRDNLCSQVRVIPGGRSIKKNADGKVVASLKMEANL